MARRCDICGKGPMSGNTVSKSMNHQRRVWRPNLIDVKTEIDGRTVTLKRCSRCLKSNYVVKKVLSKDSFFISTLSCDKNHEKLKF